MGADTILMRIIGFTMDYIKRFSLESFNINLERSVSIFDSLQGFLQFLLVSNFLESNECECFLVYTHFHCHVNINHLSKLFKKFLEDIFSRYQWKVGHEHRRNFGMSPLSMVSSS